MEDKTSNCVEKSKTLEEFLNCFPLLKGDLEKGLFLLGVLTGYLLKIQAARLDGNKPFIRKLKGFKLRKKDFENLYTELLNKLEEYDQAGELPVITKYIKYLIEKTTEYLLSSAEWSISDKEANFLLASGIGLSGKVLEILKEQFKEEETKQEV
jgi:CRISPR-associated protein Cas8b/Csh1 subtype I-B